MPENTAKPKRAYRKTSETQKIIFDKAMAIMSEKGFQGTTVREICLDAKIPIGTFYNCYKSKIDILKRIYDAGDIYMLDIISQEAEGKPPLETLEIFADCYAKLNEDTGIDVMRVLFYPANEWFSHDRPMQVYARSVVLRGQDCGEIRSDIGADSLMNGFFDILRGICYNWCVCNGAFSLRNRIALQIKLYCEAIAAKK